MAARHLIFSLLTNRQTNQRAGPGMLAIVEQLQSRISLYIANPETYAFKLNPTNSVVRYQNQLWLHKLFLDDRINKILKSGKNKSKDLKSLPGPAPHMYQGLLGPQGKNFKGLPDIKSGIKATFNAAIPFDFMLVFFKTWTSFDNLFLMLFSLSYRYLEYIQKICNRSYPVKS